MKLIYILLLGCLIGTSPLLLFFAKYSFVLICISMVMAINVVAVTVAYLVQRLAQA